MPKLVVGNIEVDEKGKASGYLPLEEIPEAFWPPLTIIRGKGLSPFVSITAGVHGCEYSSIQAAKEIALQLQPDDLVGTVLVSPIVNMAGFFSRRPYLNPMDEKNLNRCFPGSPDGSPSEKLAYQVTSNFILPADFYLDLHGGDIVEALTPFTLYQPGPSPEIEAKSRAMAINFGIPVIIKSRTPGSTYEAAVNSGKPAILAEAGQQGILSQAAIGALTAGVYRVLHYLDGLTEKAKERLQPIISATVATKIFLEEDWMRSPLTGMWYPSITCGQQVSKGQVLGEIGDFFDTNRIPVTSESDGLVVFLLTSLAVSQGDALLAVAHCEEKR